MIKLWEVIREIFSSRQDDRSPHRRRRICPTAPKMAGRVLITGAVGQIGSALVPALKLRHGVENAWSILFKRLTPSRLLQAIIARSQRASLPQVFGFA